MDIENEPGWFWWAHEDLHAAQIAPERRVSGTLRIKENGSTFLNLDDRLSSQKTLIQGVLGENNTVGDICGILKKTNRRVILNGVRQSGGQWSSNGISYDIFSADYCYITNSKHPRKLNVSCLEIDLDGMDDWICNKSITYNKNRKYLNAKFRLPVDIFHKMDHGTIRITPNATIDVSSGFYPSSTTIKNVNKLIFRPRHYYSIPEIVRYFGFIEELMLILTNSNVGFNFPTVRMTTGSSGILFFYKIQNKTPPISYHSTCTSLPMISNIFGSIFEKWISGRHELGPGYYLYTSTRRSIGMYVENRFLNLVSGMESLHRTRYKTSKNPALEARIARILSSIENSKDRAWLKRKSKRFFEPTLADRIVDLISSLPIDIDSSSLHKFCSRCAKIRNNLAHTGKHDPIGPVSYREINAMSDVLEGLYHSIILTDIGTPIEMVQYWLTESIFASLLGRRMQAAGIESSSIRA